MSIARVFPRKTAWSPDDDLAFFAAPDLFTLQRQDIEAVHISVTFTYDLEKADQLYKDWQALGVPVLVGGPAFDDRMGDFTPGLYIKKGGVFTSRGCTKECWFCSVPRCSHGVIRELSVQDGYNIMDDNILGTSMAHFEEVIEMLKRQKEKAIFSGGLEPQLMTDRHAELLKSINPARMYTAYDTKDDLEPLREMRMTMRRAGFSDATHSLCCYVLIGYDGDTFDAAERRMLETMDAGYVPFAMLYRDESGEVSEDWKPFQREWCRPIITCGKFDKWRKEKRL